MTADPPVGDEVMACRPGVSGCLAVSGSGWPERHMTRNAPRGCRNSGALPKGLPKASAPFFEKALGGRGITLTGERQSQTRQRHPSASFSSSSSPLSPGTAIGGFQTDRFIRRDRPHHGVASRTDNRLRRLQRPKARLPSCRAFLSGQKFMQATRFSSAGPRISSSDYSRPPRRHWLCAPSVPPPSGGRRQITITPGAPSHTCQDP